MTTGNFPLFDWRPPCRVLVFPLDRRVGRIRQIAEALSRKDGFWAQTYWKQIVTSSMKQLLKAGLSEQQANDQVAALFAAVQAEMTRQYLSGTGGAA